MKFHSTSLSYTLAVFALIIYIFFIMSSMGVSGLLLSFAIGMIAAAFIEPLELVVALVIVAGIVLTVLSRQLFIRQILATKSEGFEAGMGTGRGISDLVVSLEEGTYKVPANRPRVKAVYSEIGFGYAPVQSTEGFQSTPNEDDEEGEEADSTPAPKSEAANTTKLVDKDAAAVQTAAAAAQPDATSTVPGGSVQPSAASGTAAVTADGFTNSASLFQLGKLPSESALGPHVDIASTMNNALSALQPEQMAAMTAESNSLVETQRNLMNMLQTMRPVLQDGRQLLDTFSGIFGNLGLGGGAKPLPTPKGGFQLGGK
jgi:hypothetical protein